LRETFQQRRTGQVKRFQVLKQFHTWC